MGYFVPALFGGLTLILAFVWGGGDESRHSGKRRIASKLFLVGGFSLVAFLVAVFASGASATKLVYQENFTTTQYKDTLNTTAHWDTVAGELKLFPFESRLAGTYATPGAAMGVAVSGDHAFVADGVSGLQVIDISDPTSPTRLGWFDTPGSARGIAVSGDHAFVADYYFGLQVIDISDPTSPTFLGSYDTPGAAVGVAVSGDCAFVADVGSGLQVIDISDPTSPTFLGSYNTPDDAWGVAVSGDCAFVADAYSGLQVIDISDPTSPTFLGSYVTPGAAMGVAVSGDHAFVADRHSGLQVIDISDPTSPTFLGSYNTPGFAFGVAVSGDQAFVADYLSGLQVIDISDPTSPTLLGNYDTPNNAYGVAVSGDHAFVADGGSGLQVIAISDPTSPTLLGSYDTPGAAVGVTVSGDHAFVADNSFGLQVIDISDPTSPTLLGSYDTPGFAQGVAVSGDHAFVADGYSGFQVIDISDPTSPTLLGNYDTPSNAYGVAVSGDYAFVADEGSGLQVIDISDPTSPTLLGNYDTPSNAYGVAVSGDHAFVADEGSGLQVIDISDPTSPTLLGNYDTPGIAYGVAVSGDHAFVADVGSGLQVIDISDPTSPTLLGNYDTPGAAFGVAVSGDRAFVADGASGLQVIDISDPTSPTLLGNYDTPGAAFGVAVSGDCAFVAASDLQVIHVFQSEVDADNNIGRSLAVDASNDTILGARLLTTQTSSVTWELSADGGVNWQEIAPDGAGNRMTVPGTDLLWRSTLSWANPGGPAVTDLEIEWLVAAAAIDSIVDVPDDQGGWVDVHFTRSGRDFSDETAAPISSYGIWRRMDSAALNAAMKTASSFSTEKSADDDILDLSGIPFLTYQGKIYVQSQPGFAASSFPPGTWEWVATVPAIQQQTYIAAVPTAVDSSASGTNHTVFVMTAHTTTPSIWYVSEPDSGYSLDNIAPAVPEGFAIAYHTGSGNQLAWDPCPDEDFQYFNIYRSNDPNFVPSPSDLVQSATGTGWTDPDYDGGNIYYKVTALDFAGNESDPATPETVTAVNEPVSPRTFALYSNVPNPFNPRTTIRFELKHATHATLRVFDVAGRLVTTLVNEERNPGMHEIVWRGKDSNGKQVATGVYVYRLLAGDFVETKRMVLLR